MSLYRYKIICINRNNGSHEFYAVVKRYITNISTYIEYHPTYCYDKYSLSDEPYIYNTVEDATNAITEFKEKINKTIAEKKKRKEDEKKAEIERKKREAARKQHEKEYIHGNKIKKKIVINCN